MEQQVNPALQALNVLVKAAELYTNTLDDLARQCVIPQLQAAMQTVAMALQTEGDTTDAGSY